MNKKLFLRSIPIDVAAVILVGFILIVLNLRNDIIYSPDSYTYIKWADLLIYHNFNFLNYYGDNDVLVPSILYSIPVGIIALLKFLFGESWVGVFYAINIFSMMAVIELFRRCLRLLEMHPIIISLMTGFFLISPFGYWPHYLLSDTIFAFFVMGLMYSMIFALTNRRSLIPTIFFCLLLTLTRPTGMVYVFGTIIFILFYQMNFLRIDSKRIFWALFLLLLSASAVYGLAFSFELENPSKSVQLKFIREMIVAGVVIHDRPETFIDLNLNFFEISYLFALRFLMFFSPYASTYSLAHIIANCILFAPFIISIAFFIFHSLSGSRKDNGFELFILLLIIFVGIFHAATLIDFDWRYRYPIIPPMLIFSTLLFAKFLNYIEHHKKLTFLANVKILISKYN